MKINLLKIFTATAAVLLLTTSLDAADSPIRKIRVGFFEFDGYHMIDKTDQAGKIHRSGYGYEILQMLKPYTNWEYEYVGYDKGWSVMLPMLEKGEIDLVTSAVKIPEKEIKFDFSSRPIGYSSVIMTVKAGCTRFLQHDYPNWSGMKVGMIRDNSKNKVFSDFAKEKNFTYQEVLFTQAQEMWQALQDGKIDAIVTGSLRRLHNEWLYEQLDVRPFYAIVKKGNQHLLNELNSALQKMELDNPWFVSELHKKYYDHTIGGHNGISFSLEEQAFLSESKKSNRKFRVLVNPDRFPFSYFDDEGKMHGIMKRFLDTISSRSGLELEPIFCRTRQEYATLLANHECDMVFDLRYDLSAAEQRGFILTPSYVNALITKVSRKNFSGNVSSCALVEHSDMAETVATQLPQGCNIVLCASQSGVLDVVKTGRVDVGYVFSKTAEIAILNDHNKTLSLQQADCMVPFAIGVKENLDRRLVSIVSKAVRGLSSAEVQQALLIEFLRWKQNPTFRDLVAENSLWFSLSLIGLVAILGVSLACVLLYQRRANKAAALLAKNSRMWKALLDTLPVHIFAKDTVDFCHFFCNRERADFFAKTPEQLIGVTDYDYLPADFAEKQMTVSRELVLHPDQVHEQLAHVADAQGNMCKLRIIQKTFQDEDGTRLLLGCAVDLTALENARQQAQESSEWFQKTLISIGDGVLTTDNHGNITLLNPVAEKMLGTVLEDCKGKKHTDYFNIVSYLDGEPVKSPVERCLNAGEIVTLANHTDLISRNGQRYHIADSAAPIRGHNGKIAGAILVFRDVTREYDLRDKLQANAIQLENALSQAQHASSAKGVFLSQMSHEIRTPLNAIIGYLNIAQDCGEDGKKIKECLAKGLDASSHLLSIINDILDISSIESGKLKIAHEDFDFKHLLTGIVSMFYNQAENKKVRFDMELRDLTEEWLVGDSLRVNQILLNLLSNAMKFTPSGGAITLRVQQLATVNNRVPLMIRVADTGCGMSNEFKSRLFKPFEQEDASTARKFGGTGLGLSITKNLVDMMGGTIDVVSKENEGTTFTIHLSFEKSAKMLAVAEADFSKLRALVADDKEEDRNYIQMVLKKCGVKSDAVDSGEAALEKLKLRMDSRHPYDLCLLDMRLPGISGLETSRKIRALSGITDHFPIILVTAYDVVSISTEAHEAGVNKIIQKPLFQSTFFDFLMSSYYHLNEKQNTQEVKEGLKGLNILLAEDNQMNMDISTQYLERAGMKITPVWNGQEAVEKFTASAPGTFQVILMDIQMPIMDGYQATEKIRSSSHPEAKTIPIIAMTANAFNEDIVKALSSGMNDHISKPVFYDRLFATISKLIKKEGC